MKKIAFLFAVIIAAIFLFFLFVNKRIDNINNFSLIPGQSNISKKNEPQEKRNYLFVPYWTLGQEDIQEEFSPTLLYFGISVNENGIDREEDGFYNLNRFVNLAPSDSEKILVIRVVNKELASKVFEDKNLEKKIITESIDIAKEYGFDGIALDFEFSAISFPSVVGRINSIYSNFYKESNKNNLSFISIIFGDTYYRARPYDIKFISNNSDKIIVMAYDFHKANGNPGPNFPLGEKNIYGYDFKEMVEDFAQDADFKKLVFAFGLFGYDWEVDEKGNSKAQAEALAYIDIKNEFLNSCQEIDCRITTNKNSQEANVSYIDNEGEKHVVWLETPASMQEKIKYLQGLGFNQTAIWAYSYF